MTTYVLRCVDKAGSFDHYILNTKPKKLDSDIGMEIRSLMLVRLGLDPFKKQRTPILLPTTEAGQFNISPHAIRLTAPASTAAQTATSSTPSQQESH